MNFSLKNDILNLKSKLENIENEFEQKVKDLADKESKFKSIDERIDEYVNSKDSTIKLNIGGKIFLTKVSTILNIKDTLFYQLLNKDLEENKNLTNKEYFFDRPYKFFPFILDYLRTKKFSLKPYNKYELEDIQLESKFYGLNEILVFIEEVSKEVEIIGMDAAPRYSNAGTHTFLDLKDKSLSKGVCVQSPYHIIFELNFEHEITLIEIGGWNGNSSLWYVGNGSGATIHTSTDKINWNKVGTIPSSFGNSIIEVSLTPSIAKYVKFQHNSYLGIGYLNFKKANLN